MNLVVIVPTCNRPVTVENLLLKCAWDFKWYGIDIVIYDSSDNNKTKIIIENFLIDGCDNIIYEKQEFDEDFNKYVISFKLIDIYKEYYKNYDYIWVCNDEFSININSCYRHILKWSKKKYDCIVVDSSVRNNNISVEKTYEHLSSADSFFREQATRMKLLGSIILSSKCIKKLINNYLIDYKKFYFWQLSSIFYEFSNRELKIASIIGDFLEYNNTSDFNNYLRNSEFFFEYWVFGWYTTINNLPEIYNKQKKIILKKEVYGFHPFYLSSLIQMRAKGNFNITILNKYKNIIPEISNTPLIKFYIAAIMPKSIATSLSKSLNNKFMIRLRYIYTLIINSLRRKNHNE